MNNLRLMGLSEDGSRLVMESPDGNQYFLPVDERIHAALRGDRARLGQLQIEMESKLTPREIQDRIRAGQSLNEVAIEAGVPIDRVLRYAGPILQEREHIAQEAAKAGVKRDDHGAVMLLGELVRDRLEDRGVPRESMTWDAWRRDDGGWEVRLEYVAGDAERSAQWVYDPSRRTVTPDDDDARWLLEEEAPAPVTHLRPVRESQPVPEVAEEPPLVPDVEPAEPSPAERARQRAIDAANRQQRPTVPDSPPPRKKKASVPSWDEIVFGSKKPE